MTTWDPDTQASDPAVLAGIVRHFGGRLALDPWVPRGDAVRVGDPVERTPVPDPPRLSRGRYHDER